jgi:hypothetical protein
MEKEVSESERKVLVRRKYLTNISEMLQMPLIEQKDLFTLIKNFFSEYLKLEYEFTYEELSEELNKIYIKQLLKTEIDNFLYDLSETQYFTDKEMEKEEIIENIKKLRDIINELIIEEKESESKKPSFFGKLFGKTEGKKEIKDDAPTQPEADIHNNEITGDKILPTLEDKKDIDAENKNYKDSLFENENNDYRTSMNIISDIPDLPSTEIKPAQEKQKPLKQKKISEEEKILPIKQKVQKKNELLQIATEKITENPENILVKKGYSLLVEDNNPDIISIREHMEESYSSMFNNKLVKAKESYLKALDIYHKLEFQEKEKVYQALYELFKELKPR